MRLLLFDQLDTFVMHTFILVFFRKLGVFAFLFQQAIEDVQGGQSLFQIVQTLLNQALIGLLVAIVGEFVLIKLLIQHGHGLLVFLG